MEGLDTFDIGYAAAKAEYIPELQAKYDAELQNLRDELSATKEKLADWQAAMVSESEVSMSLRKIISEQDVRIALYSKESVELAELKRENAELRKRLEAEYNNSCFDGISPNP